MARGRERQEATDGAVAAEGTAEEQTDGRKEGRKIQFSRQRDTTEGRREGGRGKEGERETSHDKSFVAQRHFQLCALHLIEERRGGGGLKLGDESRGGQISLLHNIFPTFRQRSAPRASRD